MGGVTFFTGRLFENKSLKQVIHHCENLRWEYYMFRWKVLASENSFNHGMTKMYICQKQSFFSS